MTAMLLREARARVQWELARVWAALGALELVALAMLALWVGLHTQVTMALAAQARTVDQQVEALRAQQLARTRFPARSATADQDLPGFLPALTQREPQLLSLHQLVTRNNLALSRITYQAEPIPGLAVNKLTLHMELQGSYAAQRRFLHAVLESLPNLAVDRLALEKTAGTSDGVTARLDASLFFRAGAVNK